MAQLVGLQNGFHQIEERGMADASMSQWAKVRACGLWIKMLAREQGKFTVKRMEARVRVDQ